jgi:DNA-nicking Smr family endonuclease
MAKKKQGKTEDDAALWGRVTEGIKPLHSARYAPSKRPDEEAAFVPPKKKRPPPAIAQTIAPPKQTSLPIDLREGDHAGIDRTTRRKLTRGNLPVEARIDLHGHTAEQAQRRLQNFILDSAYAGHRCVLVITGKGTRGEGVLRRHVPLWLKAAPLAGCVLAISNATQQDGGTGAIYVMLRRKRENK